MIHTMRSAEVIRILRADGWYVHNVRGVTASSHCYFELIEKLEDMFHTPIDLAEIDQIRNPYFKEAVDETKVPVYEIA